jgi:hypothetical protein
VRFIKKPIPTLVEFAEHAGTLQTLEGPVAYEPGDALMRGMIGERWPIRRAHFESTYEPVAPVRMGENGQYIKKAIPVTAQQAKSEESIVLDEGRGTLQAKPGDWILVEDDGRQWVVTNDIFTATYQVLAT